MSYLPSQESPIPASTTTSTVSQPTAPTIDIYREVVAAQVESDRQHTLQAIGRMAKVAERFDGSESSRKAMEFTMANADTAIRLLTQTGIESQVAEGKASFFQQMMRFLGFVPKN